MNKKVLFCATVDIHFRAFHLPYLKWFKEQGWEVHVAARGDLNLPYVDEKYNFPFQRSPVSKTNILAYKELKKVINNNEYQIIHCHTPMGGVITRLAARQARKKGTKVLYTAHGFHFCKGAPLINWILYYPIEKILAHITDCLITINEEDHKLAKNHRFKAKEIKHVHGVGVNTKLFQPVKRNNQLLLRAMHGYKQDDFLIVYAAEFNKNKNQQLLIKSLALIKDEVPNAKLLLAGNGPLLEECRKLAIHLGVEKMINFLGHRNDMDLLLKMSDIAVASSVREGLPVNIMEAMACGLPVIASDNRGHRELIHNEENGYLIHLDENKCMSDKIKALEQNQALKWKLGQTGRRMIEAHYSTEKVLQEMMNLYESHMEKREEYQWAVH
ncbi:glycosyltransferase family 4 protein [Heyndrickxia sp. NPDC080065]|uniref:glycosyltransferase family 4 protein n=1 Tax=Heyndrickxia sp. NPDC080065 TaxID=3390568 RepID=UPI003D02E0F7